ncbi:MAG: TauD/TfdA family dioxygenase, partial [Gammaproteobacteria bacterium]|nr:TauD/TfdA family dioxygenase [Gammaproteobacteria bacterium]
RVSTLEGKFGAELRGVDLSDAASNPDLISRLDQMLVDHHVVAVRDQRLDVPAVLAISRCFGELEPHVLDQYHHPQTPLILVLSNRVDEKGRPLGLRDAGSFWHSDVSFKERPARATLLYALEIPDEGGDTLFCDMMAAYDALPDGLKEELDPLMAVHDYGNRDRVAHRTGTVPRLDTRNLDAVPPVRHPVIRRHPVSGRKAIYVNPTYTVRIEGVSEERSNALLNRIFDHCLEDRFCMRYRWRANDVVIWDNAAVMHSATTQKLDPSCHRTLWRTIIVGGPTS